MQTQEFEIRREVLPAVEIIASATTVAAELLGRTGDLGVVAPSALADLIVVDGPRRASGCVRSDSPV
jgi:imidazolonepropionase-like amidohydrolase